ncbi:MAG: nuclease [Leptolyngbyaceae cyanobacterium SM2_5_2]|nr:nuclease [Leptolyngbyaceae cyanobacterium SM2_5_2]
MVANLPISASPDAISPSMRRSAEGTITVPTLVASNGSSTVRTFHIQGAAHRSPLENQPVTAVPGVVTLVNSNGFYIQDPQGDGNPATSDSLFVFTGANSNPAVRVGDAVQVSGTVTEFRQLASEETEATGSRLSTTQISNATFGVLSRGNPLPAAVVIGLKGRPVPTGQVAGATPSGSIEARDYLFNPGQNALDFYESLEGMRVQANDGVVVSPSNRFGEVWFLADDGAGSNRTPRGGVIIKLGSFNPERLQVQFSPSATPAVTVGDRLSPVVGVLGYDFGNFEILPTDAITVTPGGLARQVTTLASGGERLTLASYNIENFHPGHPAEQITTLGTHIAVNLGSPDIIGLQEVQDNSGPTDDGVVDATASYQALIKAIVAAGGPTYKFFDIAPENNQDGGQPGGNIRVGYLYNPQRVSLVTRPGGDAITTNAVVEGRLDLSPGRIQPLDVAFADSRKPLAAEFIFNGQRVFTINNHFSSKSGSNAFFGRFQPPLNAGETQRTQQAQANRSFVERLLTANPDARVVVHGDLNEFQFLTPLQTLQFRADGEPVLFNLTHILPENERYAYNFEGNAQALDHVLVTQSLLGTAEYQPVHVNSEFFDQASDHDPLLARFNLANMPSAGLNNVVRGTSGNNEIAAQGSQQIFGNDGSDIIGPAPGSTGGNLAYGGNGNDLLIAHQNDTLNGGPGNDYLSAADGLGRNTLNGGPGDDLMFGGVGDRLHGGTNNDVLYAGRGGSVLTGGGGSDQFWIAFNQLPESIHIITDFLDGNDIIGLRSVPGLTRFEDLTLVQRGADVLIQALGQDVALFQNMLVEQITSSRVVVV